MNQPQQPRNSKAYYRSMDRYSSLLYTVGPHAKVYGNKHWHHPWYARNVLCNDGHRRTAYYNTDATYVRVKVANKWQKGYLDYRAYPSCTNDDENDLVFHPYVF